MAAAALPEGGVLLIENVRFYKEEEKNDPEFAKNDPKLKYIVVPGFQPGLSCLTIKDDKIEAKVVHEQLCSMVERLDAEILGPHSQYLPKIVSILQRFCAMEQNSPLM